VGVWVCLLRCDQCIASACCAFLLLQCKQGMAYKPPLTEGHPLIRSTTCVLGATQMGAGTSKVREW
jgi:hypothetical protein